MIAPYSSSEREIGKEQMMIDDDDVALQRPLMHRCEEASLELLALLPAAQVAPGIHLGPRRAVFRERFDFGTIAGDRRFLPLTDDLEVGDFLQSPEHGLSLGIVDFLAANKVRAPLHVADL